LRAALPKSPREEMATWKALRQFLYHGNPSGIVYSNDDALADPTIANPVCSPPN
jgi:hypothetical protein